MATASSVMEAAPSPQIPAPRTCASCRNPASNRCTGCRKVYYCGTACQRNHLEEHRPVCKLVRKTACIVCGLVFDNAPADKLPGGVEICLAHVPFIGFPPAPNDFRAWCLPCAPAVLPFMPEGTSVARAPTADIVKVCASAPECNWEKAARELIKFKGDHGAAALSLAMDRQTSKTTPPRTTQNAPSSSLRSGFFGVRLSPPPAPPSIDDELPFATAMSELSINSRTRRSSALPPSPSSSNDTSRCYGCGREFRTASGRRCEQCDVKPVFCYEGCLGEHNRTFHPTPQIQGFVCSICAESCPLDISMRCSACNEHFCDRACLVEHCAARHGVESVAKCYECREQFAKGQGTKAPCGHELCSESCVINHTRTHAAQVMLSRFLNPDTLRGINAYPGRGSETEGVPLLVENQAAVAPSPSTVHSVTLIRPALIAGAISVKTVPPLPSTHHDPNVMVSISSSCFICDKSYRNLQIGDPLHACRICKRVVCSNECFLTHKLLQHDEPQDDDVDPRDYSGTSRQDFEDQFVFASYHRDESHKRKVVKPAAPPAPKGPTCLQCKKELSRLSSFKCPGCDGNKFCSHECVGAHVDVKHKGSEPPTPADACVVCLDLRKDTLILPCKHMTACFKCAAHLFNSDDRRCPVCRGDIKEIMHVFL